MIENSALRPQLYQQVRSWTLNDTALSSANPLSDSFGLSSDLLIASVFFFFCLLFMFIWETTPHPCFSKCRSIFSMALLNILLLNIECTIFLEFSCRVFDWYVLGGLQYICEILTIFPYIFINPESITADFYGKGFRKLSSFLGHPPMPLHPSVLGTDCICPKVIKSGFCTRWGET